MATQLLQQHIPVDDLVNLVGSYLMVSAESVSASKQCVIDEFIQRVPVMPLLNNNPWWIQITRSSWFNTTVRPYDTTRLPREIV
jgi:hypothetical protein